jgi:hypothetical protein
MTASEYQRGDYITKRYFFIAVLVLSNYKRYCHVFMVPWRITTGFGLDDWIHYNLLIKSFLITPIIALLLIYPLHKSLGHAPFSFPYSGIFLTECSPEISRHIASDRTYRKHRLRRPFYCCVTSPRMRKLCAFHSNGCCVQSQLLATGLYVTT